MNKLIKITLCTFICTGIVTAKPLCFADKVCDSKGNTKACYEFKVGMYKTPYPWLNQFIAEHTFSDADNNPNQETQERYERDADGMLLLNEKNLQLYVKEVLNDFKEGEIAAYLEEESIEPNNDNEYIAETDAVNTWSKLEESPHFLQIANSSYSNPTGLDGGHGYVGGKTYYVFRKDTQSLLQGDISAIGKGKALDQLLYQELSANYSIGDYNEEQSLHANWHLAKNAIVFDYGAWDLGFHVDSHFPVSVEKLEGLVREEILQAAREWSIPHRDDDYDENYDNCSNN